MQICSLTIGAHITIFSRNPDRLEKAKQDIDLACLNKDQEVNAVAIDMSDASRVLSHQPRVKLKSSRREVDCVTRLRNPLHPSLELQISCTA